MLKKLIKLANDLDKKGLYKEADFLDRIILKKANLDIFKTPHMWADEANFKLVTPESILDVVNPLMDNLGLSTSQEVIEYLLKNNYILPQNKEWQPRAIQLKLDQALSTKSPCIPLTEDQRKSLKLAGDLTIGQYSAFKVSDEIHNRLQKEEKVCEQDLTTIELEAANFGIESLLEDVRYTLEQIMQKAIEASK